MRGRLSLVTAVRRPRVVPMRTAIFPAKLDQLDSIRHFAGQAASDLGMAESEVYAVELAVDEACSNMIEYAYHGIDGGDIECTCDPQEDKLVIVLRDHGKPFDPSKVPPPDLQSDIHSRKVGGLGIYLMRHYMDEVHFEQLGKSGNLVTMIKRRKAGK